MSTLVLVRHGQASFFEDDYDRLSPRGEEQAEKLAEYWLGQNQTFHEVYTGNRVRQIRTAEIIAGRYREAGIEWPEPVTLPELDEHHVDELVTNHMTGLCSRFPHLTELSESFGTAAREQRQRRFQLLFEAVAGLWLTGQSDHTDVESWVDFSKRVNRAVDRIVLRKGSGRRIAAFSSVGPIFVAFQRAVECPDAKALAVGWRLWNCSLTEFIFKEDRFTLERFNALPHLLEREEWTHR